MDSHLKDVASRPWTAEVGDILALAERKRVSLSRDQIRREPGGYVISGMEWCMWLACAQPDTSR